jgi:hypothetical protein
MKLTAVSKFSVHVWTVWAWANIAAKNPSAKIMYFFILSGIKIFKI